MWNLNESTVHRWFFTLIPLVERNITAAENGNIWTKKQKRESEVIPTKVGDQDCSSPKILSSRKRKKGFDGTDSVHLKRTILLRSQSPKSNVTPPQRSEEESICRDSNIISFQSSSRSRSSFSSYDSDTFFDITGCSPRSDECSGLLTGIGQESDRNFTPQFIDIGSSGEYGDVRGKPVIPKDTFPQSPACR